MKDIRTILIGVFAAYLGFAMLSPLLAPLTRALGLTEVQAGSIQSVAAFAWFLAGPFWGRRSDILGRKAVFIIGAVGFGAGLGLFTLVAQAGLSGALTGAPLFALLFVGRFIGGVLFSASPASAQAFIADATAAAQRTRAMASYGAAIGMSFVVGPALSAGLAGFGLVLPLVAAACLPALGGLVVALRLPEPEAASRCEDPPRLSPTDARVRYFLLIGLVANIALVMSQITAGFLVADRLKLSPQQVAQTVGVGLVVAGLTVVAVQLGIVRRIKRTPVELLRVGLVASLLSYLTLMIAHSVEAFILAFVLIAVGIAFNEPGFTSATTLAVEKHEYGAVSGLTASTVGLASMIAPVLGTALYQVNLVLPYAVGAAVIALMILFVWLSPRMRIAAQPATH